MMTIFITLLILIIDIVSKMIVVNYLSLGESVKFIDKFLYLTYVRNTGAAWSILADNTYIISLISLIIILTIIWYIGKNKINSKLEKIAYALVLGGAIGNFVNRILYGYVIDFIDVKIFGYNYPIFNLADVFIVVGVVLLAIYNWRNSNGNKSN